MSERFDRERATLEAWSRDGLTSTRWIARTFDYRAQTDSTNDDARAAGREGREHGHAILAESQRAGRGRRGRAWIAPEGTNLSLSVLLRPALEVSDAPLLALVTGLAVARACDRFVTRGEVTVKWPNDVRIERKKVAGVLVEGAIRGERFDTAVVGVGLNVHARTWPPELSDRAAALEDFSDRALDRTEVLRALFDELERAVDALLLGGSSRDALLRELRARCDTLQTTVSIDGHAGRAVAIADDGALVIEHEDGTRAALRAGEVIE